MKDFLRVAGYTVIFLFIFVGAVFVFNGIVSGNTLMPPDNTPKTAILELPNGAIVEGAVTNLETNATYSITKIWVNGIKYQ